MTSAASGIFSQVKALVDTGVAVCGHIGLTPQSYAALGGYRVQGKTAVDACKMLEEAQVRLLLTLTLTL